MKASLNIILNQSILTDLKKAFVADKTIQKMAKEDFIMLNVVVIKDMLHMQKIYIYIHKYFIIKIMCNKYYIVIHRKRLRTRIWHLTVTMFPESSLLVNSYIINIISI